MINRLRITVLLLLLAAGQASAQTSQSLRLQLQQIVSKKKALVGISIIGSTGKDTLSINGDGHYPLQSVFKFHIALAVLAQVDKGLLSLHQKITIRKKDLLPGLYSPIRERYPNGGTLPLSEVIYHTVAASDNVGCDALLRLLGGPQIVENYFRSNQFKDLSIRYNEEDQQNNWNLQFQNWTTPKAASHVLAAFYYNQQLLSKKSHAFIWKVMRETKTGHNRLRGQLPASVVVAHKTGSSGTNDKGITAAVNDIGVVLLPDGKPVFISVFITDSKENAATNEKIIADIAKATWNHYTAQSK